MTIRPIADCTIETGEPELCEDGEIRYRLTARFPDGTWMATYWHPPLPPRPGMPGGNWQTIEEFTSWIEWARS